MSEQPLAPAAAITAAAAAAAAPAAIAKGIANAGLKFLDVIKSLCIAMIDHETPVQDSHRAAVTRWQFTSDLGRHTLTIALTDSSCLHLLHAPTSC